jgi:hypothetical protein
MKELSKATMWIYKIIAMETGTPDIIFSEMEIPHAR